MVNSDRNKFRVSSFIPDVTVDELLTFVRKETDIFNKKQMTGISIERDG